MKKLERESYLDRLRRIQCSKEELPFSNKSSKVRFCTNFDPPLVLRPVTGYDQDRFEFVVSEEFAALQCEEVEGSQRSVEVVAKAGKKLEALGKDEEGSLQRRCSPELLDVENEDRFAKEVEVLIVADTVAA
jgi:hypothetical protein